LDLVKNHLIAKLLNDIQRYLDKKIIIIFAYRERQLENSLFEDLITDNQRLLEREVIDNGEVFSQINQFLLKLVPLGNRVPLFSKNDLLNKEMQAILKSIDLSLDKELRIFKVNNQSISNQEENASAYPELIDKGISFVDELNYLINHKMENEIVAPADGVVASVAVKEGDTVETDATLVVLK